MTSILKNKIWPLALLSLWLLVFIFEANEQFNFIEVFFPLFLWTIFVSSLGDMAECSQSKVKVCLWVLESYPEFQQV